MTKDLRMKSSKIKLKTDSICLGKRKTQELVTLNYLTHQQFAFLQSVDFKLKRASQTLKFAYDKQLNIIAIFADEDAAPLARYVYDTDANSIQAFDQNGHSRQYIYNHAHQLTRYTDRTGRGQNILKSTMGDNYLDTYR